MQNKKRLFIAIDLNQANRDNVNDIKNAFIKQYGSDRAFRWTANQNLHLTLCFLGDTNVSKIPAITAILEDCGLAQSQFDLEFSGLGCFPDLKKPRVFWIGVKNPQNLRLIYNRLVREVSAIVDLKRPRFSPHLTISRFNDFLNKTSISNLKQFIEANQETYIGKMSVKQITLFESDLHRNGPIYKSIHYSMLK